jgi:hypothetical protein
VNVKFWASIFGSGCSRSTAVMESGNVPGAFRRRQAARINTTNRHATVAANVSCSQQYSDTAIRKLCPRYEFALHVTHFRSKCMIMQLNICHILSYQNCIDFAHSTPLLADLTTGCLHNASIIFTHTHYIFRPYLL